MEQTERRDPEDARVAGEAAEAIGAYLSRQRRLRGISLEELAAATRIPVRSLQRLETGAFDREPDGFARGFVRTVAVALGLPPEETVARMLPEATEATQRGGRVRVLGRRLAPFAALLALIAVGLLLWRGSRILPDGWTRDRDAMTVRRDAIRALAEEQARLGNPASEADAPEATDPVAAPPPER